MKYINPFFIVEDNTESLIQNNKRLCARIMHDEEKFSEDAFRIIVEMDKTTFKDNAYIIAIFYTKGVSLTDLKRVFHDKFSEFFNNLALTKRVNMEDNAKLVVQFHNNTDVAHSPTFNLSIDGFRNFEQFVNTESLKQTNDNLQWFIDLNTVDKIKYIKNGNVLTDEQFDYLNK